MTEESSHPVPEHRWSTILDVLHTIAVAGTEAEDEDRLLERATQIVGELLSPDNFGVMLLERENGTLSLHPSYQRKAGMNHLRSVPVGRGITGQVAQTGRPLRAGDVSRHPSYIAVNPPVKSELCVPLIINGEVIGVVDAESCELDDFSDVDEQVLVTLAAQLATAIDRLRRTTEARQHAQRIGTIYELGREITAILQLDELLPTIVRLISVRLDLHSVQVALVEDNHLICRAHYGSAEPQREPHIDMSIQESPFREVINTGKPCTLTTPEEMVDLCCVDLKDVGAEIIIPLCLNSAIIGVLIVTCKHPLEKIMCDPALLEFLADQVAVAIQNAQLFAAARENTQELSSLYEIALVTSSVLDPSQLVKRLYEQIKPLLAPEDFYLALYDQENEELDIAFLITQDLASPEILQLHQPLDAGGLTGWVMQKRQSLLINDITTEPLPARPCGGSAIRSYLGVPLLAHQQLIGALSVSSSRKCAFNTHHRRFLESVAHQVAMVLINVQLHYQAIETAKRLAILHSASQELISIRADADEVYRAIHETTSRLMESEVFVIALLDRQKAQIYFPYWVDRGERRTPRRIPYGQGLSGQIIATGESRLIPDVQAARDREVLDRFRFGHPPHVRSVLAVPLRLRGRVFGMISTQSYRPRVYTAEDQRILEMLAFDAAIALENARLFIAEQRRRQELEAVRQATLHLTSSLELKPVLQAILKHTLQLVEGDDAHIFLYDGEKLHFGAARWTDGERHKPFSEPRDDGITYTVARSGKRLIVEDLSTHPLFKATDWEGAILGLPLLIDQRVIGVMSIAFLHPHPFSENELRVLSLLADQAAIAIRNARLFADSQERAADLARALERLQQLDTMKNQFIQNTSHELRTPVTLIRGHAELLETGNLGALPPEQQKSITIIARRSRMLSKMLEDLNAILKTETRQIEPSFVELVSLLQDLLEEFQIRAQQEELTLEATIEPETATVMGDEVHLHRVMDNLLDNAMKFTPPGGKVALCFWKEDRWCSLEVSDTGIGIPEEKQDRIFERFYQVDGSMTRPYGGTGLGLALVKEIVEAHHGDVSVESTLGEGSTFRVKLPLAQS